jgi:hypothetical protein
VAGGPRLSFSLSPLHSCTQIAVHGSVHVRMQRPAVRAVSRPSIVGLADAQARFFVPVFALGRAGSPRVRFAAPTGPTPAPPDALDARAQLCIGYAHGANGHWLLVTAEDGRGDARDVSVWRAPPPGDLDAHAHALCVVWAFAAQFVVCAWRRADDPSTARGAPEPRGLAQRNHVRKRPQQRWRHGRQRLGLGARRGHAAKGWRLFARNALVRGLLCPTAGRCCGESFRGFCASVSHDMCVWVQRITLLMS